MHACLLAHNQCLHVNQTCRQLCFGFLLFGINSCCMRCFCVSTVHEVQLAWLAQTYTDKVPTHNFQESPCFSQTPLRHSPSAVCNSLVHYRHASSLHLAWALHEERCHCTKIADWLPGCLFFHMTVIQAALDSVYMFEQAKSMSCNAG